MKWTDRAFKKEQENKLRVGDKRTLSKFLWLPKLLDHEWRWLQRASIAQSFDEDTFGDMCGHIVTGYSWYDIGWIGG